MWEMGDYMKTTTFSYASVPIHPGPLTVSSEVYVTITICHIQYILPNADGLLIPETCGGIQKMLIRSFYCAY
jgi:hypothetical protein